MLISRRNRSAPSAWASSGRNTLIATRRWCLRSRGPVDGGHAAVTDLAFDRISVAERGQALEDLVGHRASWEGMEG